MPDHELFSARGPLVRALAQRTGVTDPDDILPVLSALPIALPVAPATDRRVWDAAHGSADATTRAAIVQRAADDLPLAWPHPRASDAIRVHGDGDRDTWEQAAFARQRRLTRAAIAAAVTLDDAWIDEVVDGVVLLCEQTSWCWPAHDDVRRRHGGVLADPDDPFVDLGAGEVVGQLAWIDHLLGAQLDERAPGLRARIRREARLRIFDPFLHRRDWHWLGLDGAVHNWNPWIHGNILVAALRLLDGAHDGAHLDGAHDGADDRSVRARVLALCLDGIDRYAAFLPDDGAIDEGYAYWWNGACRALEALDVLASVAGDAFDVSADVPSLRASVGFPHRSHLGGDWFVNHADGPARPDADQPWHALFAAAVRTGDDDARDFALSHRAAGMPVASETHGCGRLLRALTDERWAAATSAPPPLPRDSWHASTQVMLAREARGSSAGLTIAAKGGHNGENHNHNDVGSFIVAVDGVPVIVDAGRPTYTASTFGPDRYRLWMMQSSWHNVPEPAGTAQGVGAAFRAEAVTAAADDDDAHLRMDLAAAYDCPSLESWERTVRLERGRASARAVIEDRWVIGPDAAPTHLTLLAAGRVEEIRGGVRITPVDAAARPVLVRWEDDIPARQTERVMDDPLLSAVWGATLTRIDLDVTQRATARVTVELDENKGKDLA